MKEHLRFLGMKVRDRVTGFLGVGTSVCFDLYGCIQTAVQPPMREDGTRPDGQWHDNNRLEIIDETPVMAVPSFEIELRNRIQKGETGPADKPSMKQLPTR